MLDLKIKLQKKELSIGSWITMAHPAIAEIMAKSGFEWITVDLEHSVITIREAEELIRIIELCGATPLVRLSANDPVQIKRVMDAGAHGIIVPMVNSAAEAESAVAAVKYPTQGHRGVGLARAQGYGSTFDAYVDWLEKNAIVIVQVEHIDAVDNLEAILSVEGVDGYFVGPYDLSGSVGVPGQFEHPRMQEAMKRIKTIGNESNKASGIHVVEPDIDEVRLFIEQGYRLIAFSVDIRMLDSACRSAIISIQDGQSQNM